MPIKVLFPSDLYLTLIREVRPLLDAKIGPTFDGGRSAETEKADPGGVQRVYSMGLDSLTGRNATRKGPEAVALRVFEVKDETPQAYFDLSDEEKPRMLQMSSSAHYLGSYSRALSQALAVVDEEKEAELRTLRVPALNFEALWLSYEADDSDVIIPMRPAEGLTVDEPMPYAKAMDALREAAKSLGVILPPFDRTLRRLRFEVR